MPPQWGRGGPRKGTSTTVASNTEGATKSVVSAGQWKIDADTTPPAGRGDGVRPHRLLEAAVASCMAITLRMIADERGIALESADVTVEVDRTHAEETVFRTTIELKGALSVAERGLQMKAVRLCPVRKTLSKRLSFVEVGAGQ
ncbi:OsmC family protein [Telmatospirillum sp.]|uniref:OsmC family protein n=1 Tax=Telmatospirillum sp. TaxID=2079197 RepID=UPI002841C425|nr:OsmC family protein [Telmatospirillum sp.]MDR3436603.1 OsmC family protein [Telmatospirillum sp.]